MIHNRIYCLFYFILQIFCFIVFCSKLFAFNNQIQSQRIFKRTNASY